MKAVGVLGRTLAPLLAIIVAAGGLQAACSSPAQVHEEDPLAVTSSALTTGGVFTRGYSNLRTNATLSETRLTQPGINSGSFGKLFSLPVDDNVVAGVLYVPALQIASGTHNVVYVATMNNSVFAFDADDGALLSPWPRNFNHDFGPNGIPTTGNKIGCSDTPGNIGIVSTPAINSATKTMYFVTHTNTNGFLGGFADETMLHAIDIVTGADRAGSPTIITTPALENQRAAVTFDPVANVVYIAWGSYCDKFDFQGLVFSFDGTTLGSLGVFDASPTTNVCGNDVHYGGGIWQSGDGLVVAPSGDLYLATGNGQSNPAQHQYGDSVLDLSASSLAVKNVYSPDPNNKLDCADLDVGVTGPSYFSKSMLLQSGKQGIIYNLTPSSLALNQPPFQATTTSGSNEHDVRNLVVWNDGNGVNLYVWGAGDVARAFRSQDGIVFPTTNGGAKGTTFATGTISSSSVVTSLSAGATQGGILWALTGDSKPGVLYAFDAETLGAPLWSSKGKSGDSVGTWAKFNPPVVANGRVYAPSASKQVSVYGAHGFMIQSDTNTSLAVNAWGVAQEGTVLKLSNACTTNNPDCTWSYRNGMILSDRDPTLAINAFGGAQEGTVLKLTRSCDQSNPDCTWTYSKGEFLSDRNPNLAINAWTGAKQGVTLVVTGTCAASNSDCRWTMPHVLLSSSTNPILSVNAFGGASIGDQLKLHNQCNVANTDCTWTFARGMMLSDTPPPAGTLSRFAVSVPTTNPPNLTHVTLDTSCSSALARCTWRWSHGELILDNGSNPPLPINAFGGAGFGTPLEVNSACNAGNTDCTFSGQFAPY